MAPYVNTKFRPCASRVRESREEFYQILYIIYILYISMSNIVFIQENYFQENI